MMPFSSPQSGSAHVRPLVVFGSIVAFWIFYSGLVTARAALLEFPAQGELAMRRAVVSFIGIVITWFMYLALRKFDTSRLPVRIAAAFLLCLPAALAIATMNYVIFNVYDPATLLRDVPNDIRTHFKPTLMLELAESVLQRYFFLMSWAAMYLALSYAARVGQVEWQNVRLAQVAQAAELRSLRYQVNPHFLFNTLNSLSTLVMARREEEAEAMILNLAHFYRASLTGDPLDDVPLVDEVALQRLYLKIEAVRFPERLRWTVDVPTDCQRCRVPGLILQPLVENAIKHGVSQTTTPVSITITARRDLDTLVINITNTGPLSTGQIDTQPSPDGTGIGLVNVRDRLAARFGSDASVTSGPEEDGGFTVVLSMPAVLQDD